MLKIGLEQLFNWMPVIWGVGFVAPVIAAFLVVAGAPLPAGFEPIYLGLVVGGTWGLIAKFGGRWV